MFVKEFGLQLSEHAARLKPTEVCLHWPLSAGIKVSKCVIQWRASLISGPRFLWFFFPMGFQSITQVDLRHTIARPGESHILFAPKDEFKLLIPLPPLSQC